MQHLTEEQLVTHYYHDDEPQSVEAHLRECNGCAAQYATIGRVLALVSDVPVPDRGDDYGEQVWSRLRWKLGNDRRRRATWISSVAAAAALAVAFFAGHFWRASHEPVSVAASHVEAPVSAGAVPAEAGTSTDKVLLLVVSDHLDSSENLLLEVANADPGKSLPIEQGSRRAGELVAANRIYRQTAARDGNERIASVLADLEPVLIELSHAGSTLNKDEVAELQKRIEAKGLLFKVRVVSAQTAPSQPKRINNNADTL